MSYGSVTSAFSPQADFFAYSSPDGCLKIWETSSGVLKQEYTPSSHLSASCTTLSWGPCKHDVSSPKKKKRARSCDLVTSISELKLIAMGTLSGDVLLYSVTSGDLHTKMSGGHTEAVNSMSWLAEEDSLFTCSSDQHIVRWSISESVVTSKWKAGMSPVNCICVVDGDSLLSASSSIVWWDIKTQNTLKTFTGHATEVTCMVPISVTENSVNFQYFLSAAAGDRVVSAWQLSKSTDACAVASFTLSDELCSLDVSRNNTKSEPFVMTAVTKSGLLHVFEHQLNGKMKKPVNPSSTVHIASAATDSEKSHPVPIHAAKITESLDSCYISYGNLLRPVFEKLELAQLDKETYLVRQSQVSLSSSFEGISKIKQPGRSKSAKVLAPGYMAPAKPTESVLRKKKRKASVGNEMPMEERLNAMNLNQVSEQEETPADAQPSSESMVHLLLQGLQSKDNKLLHTVLHCGDEALITNTVKRLPLNSIPLLLKELHRRLNRKEQGHRPCLRWLRCVLSVHLSYLMSLQEIDDYIGPVSQLIDAREATFSKMLQLKGFLDILWSQISSKTQRDPSIETKPLYAYEDVSTSEEEEEESIEEEAEMEHSDGAEDILNSSSEDDDDDNDGVNIASESDEVEHS